MTKRKRKKKRKSMVGKLFTPEFCIEIQYSNNYSKKYDYKLFKDLMDFYLNEHKRFLIESAIITNLYTGEILHEYTDQELIDSEAAKRQ